MAPIIVAHNADAGMSGSGQRKLKKFYVKNSFSCVKSSFICCLHCLRPSLHPRTPSVVLFFLLATVAALVWQQRALEAALDAVATRVIASVVGRQGRRRQHERDKGGGAMYRKSYCSYVFLAMYQVWSPGDFVLICGYQEHCSP